MASRLYGQINCSLLSSKKMASLRNPLSRYAYICTHLSIYVNYSGIFHYPTANFALEAFLDESEMTNIIEDLVDARLIEYDHDEEIVRVVGWYYKKTCPDNASSAGKLISDYQCGNIPFGSLLIRSIAEFSVGIVKRSLQWDPAKMEREKFHVRLGPFIRETYQDAGTEFLDAISRETKGQSNAVARELELLLPPLVEHRASTVPPPSPHTRQDETKRTQDEIQNETETQKEDKSNRSVAVPETPRNKSTNEMKTDRMHSPNHAMPREETKRSALATGIIS